MTKPARYNLFLILITIFLVIIGIFIFDLLTKNIASYSLVKIVILLIISVIIGVIISLISATSIPFFREFLLSYRSLLRFESLSHPILIKLSMEAPGTYHHSLMVANLAYQAAKTISADAILTRVGSYYHDIGKLSNPEIFIENQAEPSDLLKNKNLTKNELHELALIIINHVAHGLKLARKYGIPKEITAFIAEHHGTTYVRFFLEEAKKRNTQIKLRDFRYPGPKPLSRETALVMLADAIEAKVRLIEKINNETITVIVDEIIGDRLTEKQLDLSGISEDDLRKIRDSLIRTLFTIHHQRIEYPKNEN